MKMPDAIDRVIRGQNLSRDEMLGVMRLIMTGEATPAQIGGFLVGLRMKGETIDEVVAAATVMRELATRVDVDTTGLVDTCGTGGSGSNKFNVSTAAAFVAAAAGARVAKHGNRGASSISGSADLLETAGARIMLTPEEVARCVATTGVGFLFALSHHGAMKHAIGPRKEMIVRTVFNVLGPLTNPAGAQRQVLGVYDRQWLVPLAEVLRELGSEHVLVVHSEDKLDEISISAPTFVAELKQGEITEYVVSPADFGMDLAPLSDLVITSPDTSLAMVNEALKGANEAAANIVALNAGAAIYASGQTHSLKAGVDMAQDAIGSGLGLDKMKEFVDFTNQLAEAG